LATRPATRPKSSRARAKSPPVAVTDDDELQAEGKTDQAKGNLKQAGEKIKDVFK
jgi:hypothetical protein